MKKYYIPLLISFLFAGCLSSVKPITLNKKYKVYSSIQTSCIKIIQEDSLHGSEENCKRVATECKDLLKVLDKTNDSYSLMQANTSNSKYYRFKEDYRSASKHLKIQYKHLNLVIKGQALNAINEDDLQYFLELVEFPHHPMNLNYYKYMRKNLEQLQTKKKYLKFEKKYALKMYKKGYTLVNKGQYTKGLSALELAADMKNIKAAKLCGDVFTYIYPSKAKTCYKKGVELGNKPMLFDLALAYEKEGQVKEAKAWYKRSAEAGNFISLYKLYTNDASDIQSLRVSADRGYDKAQYEYGKYLSQKKDYKNAVKYLLLSSNQGFEKAYYPLGKVYFAQSSYSKAYKYLNKGSENADSAYKLGYLKEHAKGTSRNYYAASTYYKKAKHFGKRGVQKDINRVAKAQKRLRRSQAKSQQHKAQMSYQESIEKRRLRADVQREDSRIRSSWNEKVVAASRLKALTCGEEPNKTLLNISGSRIHLQGVLTHWLGKTSFIVQAHGKEYLVKDEDDKARLNKGDSVNMLAISTGHREITHGLKRSVFEAADESAIEKAYALRYDSECPY